MIDKPVDTRGYTSKGEITKSSLHSTVAVLHILAPSARALQQDQNIHLHIHAFDCLSYRGVDITSRELATRLYKLNEIRELIRHIPELEPYFDFPIFTGKQKRKLYQKIVQRGGEGVILKNQNSPYIASSSRSRNWVKVKKQIEFDAFVTGFIQGKKGTAWEPYIGAIEFSVILSDNANKKHVLGFASNITLEERKKATIQTAEGPALNPDYYGRVAEISGQDLSARQLRLTHCKIQRWRTKSDGKRPEECYARIADLSRMAAWVQ